MTRKSKPLSASPTSFYAPFLSPEQQELLLRAPTVPDLQDEIALLRSCIAVLVKAAPGPAPTSPQVSRELAKMLELLTRAVSVQSRLGAPDTNFADFSEFVRQKLAAEHELESIGHQQAPQ